MDIFSYEHSQLTFSAAQVAEAANITLDTLNNWLRPDRGIITMSSAGRGRDRRFRLRSVYQVALTAALIEQGLSAQRASSATALFMVGDESRRPGELFASGKTYLFVDHVTGQSRLRDAPDGMTLADMRSDLSPGGSYGGPDWHPIWIDPIIERVRGRLGLPVFQV